METKVGFFLILNYHKYLSWPVTLSDSFEYLCYGSMIIINILILSVRGSTLTTDCQILTGIVDPRAVRVNMSTESFCHSNIITIILQCHSKVPSSDVTL